MTPCNDRRRQADDQPLDGHRPEQLAARRAARPAEREGRPPPLHDEDADERECRQSDRRRTQPDDRQDRDRRRPAGPFALQEREQPAAESRPGLDGVAAGRWEGALEPPEVHEQRVEPLGLEPVAIDEVMPGVAERPVIEPPCR